MNPAHVSELMKGVASWNQWVSTQRAANPWFRADFSSHAFWGARLEGIDLSQANLEGAIFINAKLQGCQLTDANLCGANLEGAQLQGANLIRANLRKTNLRNASLEGATLCDAELIGANLTRIKMQGTQAQHAQFQKSDLTGVELGSLTPDRWAEIRQGQDGELSDCLPAFDDLTEKNSSFSFAAFTHSDLCVSSLDKDTSFNETRFGDCLISCEQSVDLDLAIKVLSRGIVNDVQFTDPVFGRKVRDQAWLNKWRENIRLRFPKLERWQNIFLPRNLARLLYWLWGRFIQGLWFITCNYGRNTWPWIMWSVGIILGFAFIFSSLGDAHYYIGDQVNKPLPGGLWTYLYYSIVTFTTLGFGDITAKTHTGMFWAALEVILGYVMLGGLISIFATKVARRND